MYTAITSAAIASMTRSPVAAAVGRIPRRANTTASLSAVETSPVSPDDRPARRRMGMRRVQPAMVASSWVRYPGTAAIRSWVCWITGTATSAATAASTASVATIASTSASGRGSRSQRTASAVTAERYTATRMEMKTSNSRSAIR